MPTGAATTTTPMSSPDSPSFQIARQEGGVVLTVRGDLDLAGSIRLGAVLGDLIEDQGNLRVGVDLRDVTSFDPAGLSVFTVADELARRRGGAFTLTAPAPFMSLASEEARAAAAQRHHHLVEFYDSEAFLAYSVRDYLVPALRRGDAAVIVATREHRNAFEAVLTKAGVDADSARAEGRYVAVDARETLSRFMTDGGPDATRFAAAVQELIAGVSGPARRVCIYGEMVALLWEDGDIAAAMAVEDLWNDLAASNRFSLLCAYPTTAFAPAETAGSFRAICQLHLSPALGG